MSDVTTPAISPGESSGVTRARATFALLRRELASYFQTPVAYVVGVVFLGVTATLFFSVFFLFERAEMRQFFGVLPLLLAIMMPALSMRLIAEERRRGTYELLVTLPLRNVDIVIAKFLAVWITGLFLLAPTLVFVVTVRSFGPLDLGPVTGGYFGTILLVAVYGAIGLFTSTIARNETVALVTGLVISLFFVLLDSFLILMPSSIVPFAEFLSLNYHFGGFAQGIIDSRSVVYLVSLAAGFLILAERQMTRQR